jgi:signal transduction histidine kinase
MSPFRGDIVFGAPRSRRLLPLTVGIRTCRGTSFTRAITPHINFAALAAEGSAAKKFLKMRTTTQPAVLIVADDADFARTIVARWQGERSVPAFTVVGSEISDGIRQGGFHLAIIGPIRGSRYPALREALESASVPVICIAADADSARALRSHSPRLIVLRQHDGWPEALIALATEVLRRHELLARLQRAEQVAAANQRHATLGRYAVEMRHSLNNCLTSILGNSELLLLAPEDLSSESREQVETIHTMSLRLHEVLQRFASLDSELKFVETRLNSETHEASQAPAERAR